MLALPCSGIPNASRAHGSPCRARHVRSAPGRSASTRDSPARPSTPGVGGVDVRSDRDEAGSCQRHGQIPEAELVSLLPLPARPVAELARAVVAVRPVRDHDDGVGPAVDGRQRSSPTTGSASTRAPRSDRAGGRRAPPVVVAADDRSVGRRGPGRAGRRRGRDSKREPADQQAEAGAHRRQRISIVEGFGVPSDP